MSLFQKVLITFFASISALCEGYGTLMVLRMYRDTSENALQIIFNVENETGIDEDSRLKNSSMYALEIASPELAGYELRDLKTRYNRDRRLLAAPLLRRKSYDRGFWSFFAGAGFGLLAVLVAVWS
jgi:hypothetical protein